MALFRDYMRSWVVKIYSVYALLLFFLLMAAILPPYILIKILVPHRHQIKAVYVFNKLIMMIWFPMTGFSIRVKDAHFADPRSQYVVVMNHQSMLDMFASARSMRIPGKPLVKMELLSIPLLGWLFRMSSIPVSRGDRESRLRSFQRMQEEAEKGVSILIFPEGTRNTTNAPLLPFRDGAFKLAAATGIPVLPAVFLYDRNRNPSRSVLFLPVRITLQYLPPINPGAFSNDPVLMRQHCHREMEAVIADYLSKT